MKTKTLLLIALTLLCASCDSGDPLDLESAIYTYPESPVGALLCEAGTLSGAAGIIDDIEASNGLGYSLRTPRNYDAGKGHPLIVVFAPAGRNGLATERFVRLTRQATAEGFLIAYLDSEKLSPELIVQMAEIPAEIARHWCVDTERVYLTGHSDGGTISTAMAFLPESQGTAAAIAPSAAGMNKQVFAETDCPSAPLPTMVIHNKEDHLFPGWGEQAAQWWAACNQCELESAIQNSYGCTEYDNCSKGVRTMYCEQPGGHSRWPALNAEILDFFLNPTIKVQTPHSDRAAEIAQLQQNFSFIDGWGFRASHFYGSTPDSVPGASTLSTEQLVTLIEEESALLINVVSATYRPETPTAAAQWLIPEAKMHIPGSIWLPNVGLATLDAQFMAYFARELQRATRGQLDHPLVFYCQVNCWGSWNAVQRAGEFGYSNRYWYPEGQEGWEFEGFDLEEATPEPL
ncbi:MAG: hypothetical protein IMF06_09470 [Proteobacteria bacterium]|nr:hypothetical protein [Pseudomonadota bacterium]